MCLKGGGGKRNGLVVSVFGVLGGVGRRGRDGVDRGFFGGSLIFSLGYGFSEGVARLGF